MHTLAKQESIVWPQINPVIGLDLVNEPLNVGPWAMAKTPLDFCKEHKLIEVFIEEAKEFKVGNAPIFKMRLNHEIAASVFVKQLGTLWRSPDALPIHQRALLAALTARACRDTKVANQLLIQINKSCNSRHPES